MNGRLRNFDTQRGRERRWSRNTASSQQAYHQAGEGTTHKGRLPTVEFRRYYSLPWGSMRQRKGKRRASSLGAVNPDPPAVRLDQTLGNRQAEANAAQSLVVAAARFFAAKEAVKHMRQ